MRIAAIDIGTNSIHMVVVEATGGSFEAIEREREVVQVGRGSFQGARLRARPSAARSRRWRASSSSRGDSRWTASCAPRPRRCARPATAGIPGGGAARLRHPAARDPRRRGRAPDLSGGAPRPPARREARADDRHRRRQHAARGRQPRAPPALHHRPARRAAVARDHARGRSAVAPRPVAARARDPQARQARPRANQGAGAGACLRLIGIDPRARTGRALGGERQRDRAHQWPRVHARFAQEAHPTSGAHVRGASATRCAGSTPSGRRSSFRAPWCSSTCSKPPARTGSSSRTTACARV